MKQLTRITGLSFLALSSSYGGIVLVDVLDGNTSPVATVADFARADSAITSGTVYGLPEGAFAGTTGVGTAAQIAGTGNLSGVFFESESGTGSASNTNKGNFNGDGILGDYRFRSGAQVGNVTVGGLGAVPTGENITITLWGVGDTNDSDTLFTLDYNGVQQTATTDYDTGVAADAAVQFVVPKAAGADSVSFSYQVDPTTGQGFIGWSGLSITTNEVPEPSSALLVGLAGLGLLRRQR